MKKSGFDKICKDIQSLKIQGAESVAKAALKALLIRSDPQAIRKLSAIRPTEPCLRNCLKYTTSFQDIREGTEDTLKIMDNARKKIIKIGARKIQNGMTIFTHCHSTTVISILKEAKKQGKKFKVYNTETRPNFQGRITAKDLLKVNIPVTMFIDSAATSALKGADLFIFGVDAITSEGAIINKIGNKMMAEIAHKYDIPRYACTFSWKFDPKTVLGEIEKLESRKVTEVWPKKPSKLKISNVVFEEIPAELVTSIISELGVLEPATFVSELEKTYPFIFSK
ncbi:MAG: hypothetical protein JSW08_03770 [archaeon]|nr:MAG: hypothetical protein JSW08_03770 [archaeon]